MWKRTSLYFITLSLCPPHTSQPANRCCSLNHIPFHNQFTKDIHACSPLRDTDNKIYSSVLLHFGPLYSDPCAIPVDDFTCLLDILPRYPHTAAYISHFGTFLILQLTFYPALQSETFVCFRCFKGTNLFWLNYRKLKLPNDHSKITSLPKYNIDNV